MSSTELPALGTDTDYKKVMAEAQEKIRTGEDPIAIAAEVVERAKNASDAWRKIAERIAIEAHDLYRADSSTFLEPLGVSRAKFFTIKKEAKDDLF